MQQPLVSIIIPAYNSAKYLADAIQSALNQTWANKEIIVVDDGSTDNSLAIAKAFESENVKIFSQPNNGAGAARNKGLQEAKGNYIQYLDGDDLLSPDKIAVQLAALAHNEGRIPVCSIIHFKDNDLTEANAPSPYEESFLYDDDDPVHFITDLLGGYRETGSMVAIHAWLISREIIDSAGPWNEELTIDDDGEYFCRVILNSKGIIKTPEFCYYRKYTDADKVFVYRQNKEKLFKSALKAVLLKRDYLQARINNPAIQRAIYRQLMQLAVLFYIEQPALYKQVIAELKHYPAYKFKPVLGGRVINFISGVFGWKFSKTLQYYYAKILS
ncbi:glycosyltransferase [Mucilaginibacter sp. RB4R14]|uniref:glycosyltransferase family 2 protein n=1 Tax=Mucilaginibacter aurantiaciroseus TaxID=2949308 RepID=UPI0020913704|nr:glycosyltransferase family 2 protein [Mucilaginibacter aurantiaciroseus]MCO5936063.1 glycosyltransferase [Mucilaginibacter aurantiaciroseus]